MSFSVRYFCWFGFIIRRRTNTHTLVHRRINPRSWTAKNIMAVHTDYDLIFKFKLIMPIVYLNMILIAIAHIIIKLLFQSEYIHVKIHFWQKYSYFLLLRWSFHFPFPTLCGTPFTFPQFMTAKSSCPPASFGSPSNQLWKHQGEPSVQAPSAVQDPSFGCCLNHPWP